LDGRKGDRLNPVNLFIDRFERKVVVCLQPLVSVLLPVYNGEAYVREAIESVLAQDYPNFEFVIAENASTDGTAAIIDQYVSDQRIRVIHNRETIPRLENFVRVFDNAAKESRWLKFIGDDDRFLPGCLTEMVRVAEQSERVGLVSSYYYDGDRLVTGSLPPRQELAHGPQLLRSCCLNRRREQPCFHRLH
jgi:glycosyltransferase involved in cell wall biosynthesis